MPRLASRLFLLLVSAASVCLIVSCGSATISGGSGGGSGSGGGITPPPTDHLAVADGGDNRIVIYNAPLSANESASIVIGQTSFTQGSPNQGNATPSSATLDNPWGLAMDATGNLWVADNQNCRVLEFQPPFTTGMNASLVIGEPDFETTGPRTASYCDLDPSPPLSSTYMGQPSSIAFDSKGDLWIVEASAGRVAEYVPPFSNGMAPSAVIGQTNLQNSAPCNGEEVGQNGPVIPPTAATLCEPVGTAFDSQGDLWVIDQGNARVLEFKPPFSTGMAASLVLGETTMTAFTLGGSACVYSATALCDPNALAFDRNGNLWISDWMLCRVLEFVPPFSTGMAANLVIGRPNFTEAGPWGSFTENYPNGLAFENDNLILLNNDGSQILIYAPPFSSGMNPTAATQPGMGTLCTSADAAANTFCGASDVLAY